MNTRLRVIVGLAVAQIIVAGVLVALRDANMPTMQVYALRGELLVMPAPIFAVAMGFFVLALSYLMTGALHSHVLIRVAAVAAFLAWLYSDLDIIRSFGGWVTPALIALAPAMVVIGAYTWLWDRHHTRQGHVGRSHAGNLHVPTFVGVLLIFSCFYGLPFLDPGINRLLLSIKFTTQLFALSFLLIPMLLLGGADFAEWGDTTGGWIGIALNRVRLGFLPGVAAAVVAVVILAVHINTYRRTVIYEVILGLGAVVCLGLLAWLIGLRRRSWSPHVPLYAMALTVIVTFGVLSAYFIIPAAATAQEQVRKVRENQSTVPELATFSREAAPAFAIERPALWEVASDQDAGADRLTLLHFDAFKLSNPAIMYVAAIPSTGTTQQELNGFLINFTGPNGPFPGLIAYVTSDRTEGDYQVSEIRLDSRLGQPATAPFRATTWTIRDGSHVWVLLGLTPEQLYDYNHPTFEAMARSWKHEAATATHHTEGVAAASSLKNTDIDRGLLVTAGLWGAAGLAAVVMLLLRGRRAGGLATGGLFVVVGAVIFAFNMPVQIGAILFGLDWGAWQGLRLTGVQETVAVVTLVWLLFVVVSPRRRRHYLRPTVLLLGLNIALQFMAWIYELYARSLSVDRRLTVLQAVIFLLALVWDVLMSGESLTNRGSSTVPRHSRVLMYFGYVMLVAAAILFFSSLHAQGSGSIIEPQFESDFWPQSGLGLFGTPLVVTLFLLRLSAWARGNRGGETTAAAPAPAPG
jgi:hypothetical protein